MEQLITVVNTNEFVTGVKVEEGVFEDFIEHQQQFYKPFETN